LAREDASAVTGKTRRNRARRRSVRDRKAARRIAAILLAIGVTPRSNGHNWSEVLNVLREQYASMTLEQRQKAHIIGGQLIRDKTLDVISSAILPAPPQTKQNDCLPKTPKRTGKSPWKCDKCWSWGFKSIWKSQEAAEEICAGEKDPGLNTYPCPHGNGWHVGHQGEQNRLDA